MLNPHLQELHRLVVNRFAVDSSNMPFSVWLENNTTLRGRPFSFNKYPFQRELVDDDHPNSATRKPSQVGVSEIFQRWALAFLARNRCTKGIYAYPKDEMRKKNVQTRVMPLVESNDVFNSENSLQKPVRSIQLLQIGQSFLYMTGSKEDDATSTDADFVLLDEYDLHNMEIAGLFSSRLLNSDWKIKKAFSTPTFTDYGIDGMYRASDQMEYLIKCDACNHWQFPVFDQRFIHLPNLPSDVNDLLEIDQSMIEHFHINIEEGYVCCERCRSPLDLGREDNRAWVAKYPSRKYARGRRVNPFSVATRPVKDVVLELIEAKKKDNIRRFKNTVLGEPEDSSKVRISEAVIRACLSGVTTQPEINKDKPTWVGIDVGHICHITVGQGHSIEQVDTVLVEQCSNGNLRARVAEIRAAYSVVGGLIDRHPETQLANDIRDDSNGLILPCEYRGEKEIGIVKDLTGKITHLQADRTMLLDEVARIIRLQAIRFSGYGNLETVIVEHLRNMIRIEEPEAKAIWSKLDPADHLFHTLGFMLSAIKYRTLDMALNSSSQSFLGIAAVGMAGYNDSNLIGTNASSEKARSKWQTQFLMR